MGMRHCSWLLAFAIVFHFIFMRFPPPFVCIALVYLLGPWRLDEGFRSPGLELQTIVSHDVGARNRTAVLWESSKCS